MLHKSGKWTIGLHSTDSAGGRTSTGSYRCHECCIGKFQGCDSYIGREYSEVISQDNSDEIEKINKTIAEKQKELLELVHGKKDYSKCANEMEELRQNKQLLLVKHAQTEGTGQRINELAAYVKTQDTRITEYDDKLVRKYIDQIKIYDDKFVVCFKAKMEINVLR